MTVSAEQTIEPTTKAQVNGLGPSRIFGWVLGALSVLNLVEDLNLARIVGFVEQWLAAYAAMIRAITGFVFGWISFGWVSLSESEAHMLVVASVFAAAFARAYARPQISTKLDAFVLPAMYSGLMVLILVLIPALLLPGDAGVNGAGIGLALILSVSFLTSRAPGERIPPARAVLSELVGVVGVAAILVAASYALR